MDEHLTFFFLDPQGKPLIFTLSSYKSTKELVANPNCSQKSYLILGRVLFSLYGGNVTKLENDHISTTISSTPRKGRPSK